MTWAAALGALVATLALTWPLSLHLTDSLPGDYGDPAFVSWVMTWVMTHLTRGDWAGMWNANIFFPEQNTLAFSEHFIAQALMTVPVYWASGNPLLAYNIAFLASFVLTALGTFLLARALLGSVLAAVVAAIIATFNELRLVHELAHLHTLSVHWLPFALLAFHRYFVTDHTRWLAAAVAALWLLNLSSVYYMAYAAPFVVLFVIAEAVRWQRWRTLRTWLELWAAAAILTAATLPVLLPYVEVQRRLGVARSLPEIVQGSARLDHYALVLPGIVAALVSAVVAVVAALRWPALRARVTLLLALLLLAFWLSFGPDIRSGDRTLAWPSLYAVLYTYVPGYDALRVPMRFASFFYLFLGLLAAAGIVALQRWQRQTAALAAAVVIACSVAFGTPRTLPLNAAIASPGLASPPTYLTPAAQLPSIYRAVDALPAAAVLAELPFGDPWYDIRYVFFSGTHQRRLLNGYSGLFPPSFLARQRALQRPLLDPPAAAQALAAATHVVVHRRAWPDDTGARVGDWLETFGARTLVSVDDAVLYELPIIEGLARNSAVRRW